MNHKNFRAYTCSHSYSLPWNCSPQLFDLTLISFLFSYRLIFLSSNFYLVIFSQTCQWTFRYFSNGLQRYGLFFILQIFLKFFLDFFTFYSAVSANWPNNQLIRTSYIG